MSARTFDEAVELLNDAARPIADAARAAGYRAGVEETTKRLADEHGRAMLDAAGAIARRAVNYAASAEDEDAAELGTARDLAAHVRMLLGRTPGGAGRATGRTGTLRFEPSRATLEDLLGLVDAIAEELASRGGYRLGGARCDDPPVWAS